MLSLLVDQDSVAVFQNLVCSLTRYYFRRVLDEKLVPRGANQFWPKSKGRIACILLSEGNPVEARPGSC